MHFRVTLLTIEVLCKFHAFCSVQETRHRGDCLTVVYSRLGRRTQYTVIKKSKKIRETVRPRKVNRVISRDNCTRLLNPSCSVRKRTPVLWQSSLSQLGDRLCVDGKRPLCSVRDIGLPWPAWGVRKKDKREWGCMRRSTQGVYGSED